jgi:polysaccharide export outer membrane protein
MKRFSYVLFIVLLIAVSAPAQKKGNKKKSELKSTPVASATPENKPPEEAKQTATTPDPRATAKADDSSLQSQPGQAARATDERYRIGLQDTIEVQVFRHPELSNGNIRPNARGQILLPRIDGPINVVCKTENELATEIQEKYTRYLRQPFVTVRAVDQRSQSFSVIGAVEKPGSFFLNRRIRLLELLAFAGGPNKEAGSRLIVARTGSFSTCKNDDSAVASQTGGDDIREALEYSLKDVQNVRNNIWMEPGDVIWVFEADLIYVTGNVNKPSTVRLKDQITLTQAIAAAEGLKPSTKKDKVRILRQKPNGEREEFIYDLTAIDKKKVQDPVLQPNDIVAVSEDSTKAILRGIVNGIKGGLGNLPVVLPR